MRSRRLVQPFGTDRSTAIAFTYYFIYPRNRLRNPAFRRFRTWLLKQAQIGVQLRACAPLASSRVARDDAAAACHTACITKGRARRTKRGRQGVKRRDTSAKPARRPLVEPRPRAAHGTTDCPSPADLVPRPARGPLPVLLPAAGRAGRSGDDHRRARRQGRDHRGDPPRARARPADPRAVHRIHPARAARRSRPLDHLQQDGERGARHSPSARRSS